jgi:chromosome segregation ATPase
MSYEKELQEKIISLQQRIEALEGRKPMTPTDKDIEQLEKLDDAFQTLETFWLALERKMRKRWSQQIRSINKFRNGYIDCDAMIKEISDSIRNGKREVRQLEQKSDDMYHDESFTETIARIKDPEGLRYDLQNKLYDTKEELEDLIYSEQHCEPDHYNDPPCLEERFGRFGRHDY